MAKCQCPLESGPTRGAIDAVPTQKDSNDNGKRVTSTQIPATTPKNAVTSGDWLRELVVGITGVTSLVEGKVSGQRTQILLDTGVVASLVSATHCSMLGVDVGCLQAPDHALHTASGARMGLRGRVTLEVRLGHQVCTQEFYVSSVLCHECIAGTDLLEKLGLNVQPRQRCATVEGGSHSWDESRIAPASHLWPLPWCRPSPSGRSPRCWCPWQPPPPTPHTDHRVREKPEDPEKNQRDHGKNMKTSNMHASGWRSNPRPPEHPARWRYLRPCHSKALSLSVMFHCGPTAHPPPALVEFILQSAF
ncbi:uncharacterized protein LOC142931262 isoform X2 [Petromyzon marinus]|uniref:uncharacterized protein LOC142931262 isoform X2 n=1 Tax=Petromyzon marinus TaxID=7757 RepID=UPI003F6FEDF8